MERAAVGPRGFSNQEQLPVVFKVPRFIYPTKLESLCSDYFTSRPYSLLGYGDVGIPGLLVTQCFKFDFTFRRGKCCRLYYATSGIGVCVCVRACMCRACVCVCVHSFTYKSISHAAYIVGLIATSIALIFMKSAQPALLYLVPTTLGSIVILSLVRREFVLFFTGKSKSVSLNSIMYAFRHLISECLHTYVCMPIHMSISTCAYKSKLSMLCVSSN